MGIRFRGMVAIGLAALVMTPVLAPAAEPVADGLYQGTSRVLARSGLRCAAAAASGEEVFLRIGPDGAIAGRAHLPAPFLRRSASEFESEPYEYASTAKQRITFETDADGTLRGRLEMPPLDERAPGCRRHAISLEVRRVADSLPVAELDAGLNRGLLAMASLRAADRARATRDRPGEYAALNEAAGIASALDSLPSLRLTIESRLVDWELANRQEKTALERVKRLLEIVRRDFGENSPAYAIVLYRQVGALSANRQDDELATAADRAIASMGEQLGPMHPDLSYVLQAAASPVIAKDSVRAYALLDRAYAIDVRSFGPDSAQAVQSRLAQTHVAFYFQQFGPARRYANDALRIQEKLYGADDPRTVPSLVIAYAIEARLRQHDRCLEIARRVDAITRQKGDPDGLEAFNAREMLYFAHYFRGDYDAARPLAETMVRQVERGSPALARSAHVAYAHLASVQLRQGDWRGSAENYRRTIERLRSYPVREPYLEARYAIALAEALVVGGELDQARELLVDATQASLRWSTTLLPSMASTGWRKYHHAAGHLEVAIYYGKLEIENREAVRRANRGLSIQDRRGLDEDYLPTYSEVADLLIEAGRLAEAQAVLGLLKQEEFYEYASRDGKAVDGTGEIALNALEAAQRERYRGIEGRVAALGTELESVRQRSRKEPTPELERRREDLEQQLKTANLAFRAHLDSLLAEFASAGPARNQEIGEKNLRALKTLQGTLRELGAGTVAVHYLVSKSRLHAIVTTSATQIVRTVEVDEREVNRKAFALRRAVTSPANDPRLPAKALYDILVKPIQADLDQAGAASVLVSLDGALRYVPMAALHDGDRYLVERYRFTMLTEAGRSSLKDLPARQWRVGGLGVTRAFPGFSELPSVRGELEGIVKQGARGLLEGEVHLDDEFDRARLRAVLDKSYPVIHIASHFVFQPGVEENSFLLLGDGSRLTLKDIKDADMDFNGVDLLTLSACDTATGGGAGADGREIEGFGALAQRQGAKSVVASLWPVADESTGRLMQRFYELRETTEGGKAQALQQSQLATMRGDEARRIKANGHPFFWAPFILIGNPR